MINLFIILTIIFIFLIYSAYYIYAVTRKYRLKRERNERFRSLPPGRQYESTIFSILKSRFKKGRLFQNVFLESVSGGATEIDVLAVHNTGIYVIECKNLIGKITGTTSDKYWQHIKADNTQYEFLSPIIQNNIHINACKKLLNKFNMPYYSIIVFNNKCIMPDITSYKAKNAYVIYQKEMMSLIKYLTSQKHIYSDKVINAISEIIKSANKKNMPK